MRAIALAIAALCVVACGTAPYRMPADRARDVDAARLARSGATWTCGPTVLAFRDARPTTSAGQAGRQEFRFEELPGWVERQLHATIPDRPGASRGLQVALERAYLETNASTMSFTVVLSARFEGEDGEARHYRGMDTRINWLGTEAEKAGYIERATREALSGLIRGEALRCAPPV